MYKQNSEFKSIQKKLVAAVAMVLVACIMVVSSSYAWFTLSTAPEVTGIQTSVGSNGNLEMALRLEEDLEKIGNQNGPTSFPESNKNWGNLVNLSDSSYGFDKISLAPARLYVNASKVYENKTERVEDAAGITVGGDYEGGKVTAITEVKGADGVAVEGYDIAYQVEKVTYKIVSRDSLLKTAEYGPDGRVQAIEPNTSLGKYNGQSFTGVTGDTGYGALGIGVSSGMSDAQIALRNAKTAVKIAIEQAKTDAGNSMNNDGKKLANLILKYAMNEDSGTNSTTYDAAEVKTVADAIANLQKITTTLKSTLDQAVIAVGMSQEKTITAVDFADGGFATVGGTITWHDAEAGIDMRNIEASLKAAYVELKTMTDNLAGAANALPELGEGETATYNQLADSLGYLMSTDNMRFFVGEKGGDDENQDGKPDGYTAGELKAAVGDLFLDVWNGAAIEARITGGIYEQIAHFVGEYEGSTELEVDPGAFGITFTNEKVPVKIGLKPVATKPTTGGYHLIYAGSWLGTIQIEGETSGNSISDMYGFLVDMAFRTNATNSSLMLQTGAISRVGDDETASVQGSGSYMEFTIGQADYTLEQMINLMKAVRVVFVNDEEEIVAVAGLDVTANPVVNDDDPYDYENANGKYKLTTATVTDGITVKANLRLFTYSFNEDGVLSTSTMVDYSAEQPNATAIMELIQNQATGLSAVVYLDGDIVDNSMVAISGNSMTGKMNLQFASSATLDPMDYTFIEDNAATPTTTQPTVQLPTLDDTLTFDAALTDKSLAISNVEGTITEYVITVGDDGTTKTVAVADANSIDLTSELGEATEAEITIVAYDRTNNKMSNPVTVNYPASAQP